MSRSSDDDYRRVLSALDDGDSTMPEYAGRLWRQVGGTLESASPSVSADDEIEVIVEQVRPEHRRWPGVAAASLAAAASIAVLALVVVDNDRPQSVDAVHRSNSSVVVEPDEACATYFAQQWSVDQLVDSDLETANFDAALLALDQLRSALAAADVGELQMVDIVRGSVLQASLEVESGDIDRARRTLERTPDQVRMPDQETDEARCLPGDG